MQTACYHCNAQTTNYQPPKSTTTTTGNNENTSNFSTNQGLTGNQETDQLVTNLLILLVQLLIQEFGNTQQPTDNQEQSNGAAAELEFSESDKQHLSAAIGVAGDNNTQIGAITDSDLSSHLTEGDDVELLSQGLSQNHDITNSEVRQFIELRNPPGTPKLPLSDQQTQQVANQFGLTDITVADNNGDNQISQGDHISGTQTIGGRELQIEHPVTTAIANTLNK